MKSLFEIRAQGDISTLVIEGEIGYWPAIKEEVRWQLDRLAPEEPVEVRMDSIGGDPMAAIQIYNLLKKHQGEVTIYVEGYCMSSAPVIACAGDRVITNDIAAAMIHDTTGTLEGWVTEEEAHAMGNLQGVVKKQMRAIFVKKTGQDEETIREWMRKETYFTAQEFVDAGFADDVQAIEERVTDPVAMQMAARAHNIPDRLHNESNKRSVQAAANEPTKNKSTTMEWLNKIKAKLGLGDDADEADTILTVSDLKAKADKAEELQGQIETLQEENESLKSELTELKGEQEDEADQQVKAMLDEAEKSFKIKSGQKDELAAKYQGKPDELKAVLDYIPEGAHKPGNGKPSKPSKRTSAQAASLNSKVAADLGIEA